MATVKEVIEKKLFVNRVWDEGADGKWASLEFDYICPSLEVSQCYASTWTELLCEVSNVILKVEYYIDDFVKIKLSKQQKEVIEWLLDCPVFSETGSMSLNEFKETYDYIDIDSKEAQKIQDALSLSGIHNNFFYISKHPEVIEYATLELDRLIDMTETEGTDQFFYDENKSLKEASAKANGIIRTIRTLIKKIKAEPNDRHSFRKT